MSVERQELREEKEQWETLLHHPKWKQIEQWAAEQQAHRTAAVMSGEQDTRREDVLRGEVFGIGLFVRYPQVIVEQIQVELDNRNEENEYGPE